MILALCLWGCTKSDQSDSSKENSSYTGQIGLMRYSINSDFKEKRISFEDDYTVSYVYNNFLLSIFCESAKGETSVETVLRQYTDIDSSEKEDILDFKQGNIEIAGQTAKEISCAISDTENANDAPNYMSVAGFKKDNKIYVIYYSSLGKKSYSSSIEHYENLLDSLSIESQEAAIPEKNIGTYKNLKFTLKNWNYRSENKEGKVMYGTKDGLNIFFLPAKVENSSIDVNSVKSAIAILYDSNPNSLGPVKIVKQQPVDTNVGKGNKVIVAIGDTNIPLTFITEEEIGFAIFMDVEDNGVYKDLLSSLQVINKDSPNKEK